MIVSYFSESSPSISLQKSENRVRLLIVHVHHNVLVSILTEFWWQAPFQSVVKLCGDFEVKVVKRQQYINIHQVSCASQQHVHSMRIGHAAKWHRQLCRYTDFLTHWPLMFESSSTLLPITLRRTKICIYNYWDEHDSLTMQSCFWL